MNFGQGNIGFVTKSIPAGPPFPATSADNGLSVDPITGRIVLGNDAGIGDLSAQLLSDREIEMNSLTIFFVDAANSLQASVRANAFTVEDILTGNGSRLGIPSVNAFSNDVLNEADLVASHFPTNADFIAGAFNGLSFIRDGAGFRHYQYDNTTSDVIIGDINAALNGLQLMVNHTNSSIDIFNTGNNAIVNINGAGGFTGTVTPVNSITVDGGIVTAVS